MNAPVPPAFGVQDLTPSTGVEKILDTPPRGVKNSFPSGTLHFFLESRLDSVHRGVKKMPAPPQGVSTFAYTFLKV